jgi:hypothetical protein
LEFHYDNAVDDFANVAASEVTQLVEDLKKVWCLFSKEADRPDQSSKFAGAVAELALPGYLFEDQLEFFADGVDAVDRARA